MTVAPSLEDRVADALVAVASQVTVEHRSFRAGPTFGPIDDLVESARPGGRRRRVVVAVAAAATVCLLVGAWVARHDHETRPTVAAVPTTSTVPDAVESSLGQYPTSVPSGLALYQATASGQSASGFTTQLFGTAPGHPALLVVIQPGGDLSTDGQITVVRGVRARLAPAKDFAATTQTLNWVEGGSFVQASFSGIGVARAQSMLTSLTWAQGGDHQAGFAEPGVGSLVLLGQSVVPTRSVNTLELHYGDHVQSQSPGQGTQLSVQTTTASGGLTGEYLQDWFHGTRGADGVVEAFDPGFHTLSMAWPDGRTAWLDANATPLEAQALQRVAASLVPVGAATYRALEAEAASSTRAALPLVGITSTSTAVVEVHADASRMAICLAPKGSSWICSAATPPSSTPAVLSSVVGGAWLVAAAAPTPVTVVGSGSQHPGAPLPVITATAGAWDLAVAAPPAGVDVVLVMAGQGGQGAARPPA